ncbi:response regulator [Leptolyngbya sp. ST-U4]|uniref:hybrid sensor histidine kinase/response regulator n=2 Tax=unclassified Leptolyngbya TaxID=2650499 RepID=UPI0032988ECE
MSNVWTLLITDDCQEDREVYREYLSSDPNQSYRFIEAGSAEVGLALCQKQHCDAILLDFRLPDMTGLEFLDELNQQRDTPLPVIMLTGQGDEQVAVQAMKRGAQDYLVKQDLAPDVLQLTVRNVLQQAYSKNQSRQQQERHLTAEVALRLHRSLDSNQILETAATQVQRVLECDRVMIYQVTSSNHPSRHSSSHRFNHQSSNTEFLPALIKRFETGLSRVHDPIQQFVSFLSENYSLGCKTSSTTCLNQSAEVSTAISGSGKKETYLLAPILLPSSADNLASQRSSFAVWGLLVACQNSSQRQWQVDEVSFLKDFVNQLAIALQQSNQLTETLEALATEKQLNAVRSQLVSTVSHEYRSPLAVILAAASTLKLSSSKLTESKQQQFLQTIEDEARQMTRLVEDLLLLEKFEAGEAKFSPLPFELLQFISDLIDEQQTRLKDRQ